MSSFQSVRKIEILTSAISDQDKRSVYLILLQKVVFRFYFSVNSVVWTKGTFEMTQNRANTNYTKKDILSWKWAFSNFIAPAWAILESLLSSVFICSLWCLSACLCLLLTLVRVCVYSPSCLIFPHSLLAFIIMELPKQLQPSLQEQAGQLLLHTHTVSFLSHTFCSAQPPSGHSCVCLMWNWVEQRHDAKAVVWWAWWKVESSSRWPLSGGGGCVGGCQEALTA